MSNTFSENYDPTIQDCYRKIVKVDNQEITLEIIDTAGTEQFASFKDLDIKRGDGFLLVYSVIARSTLNYLDELAQQIFRIRDKENMPIIIVGNKTDLGYFLKNLKIFVVYLF